MKNDARNVTLYCIRDTRAQHTGPIFQARREEEAVRTFMTSLNTKDTVLNQYPADFVLLCVGEKDEETGELSTHYTETIEITDSETGEKSLHKEVRPKYRLVMTGQTYVDMIKAQENR